MNAQGMNTSAMWQTRPHCTAACGARADGVHYLCTVCGHVQGAPEFRRWKNGTGMNEDMSVMNPDGTSDVAIIYRQQRAKTNRIARRERVGPLSPPAVSPLLRRSRRESRAWSARGRRRRRLIR